MAAGLLYLIDPLGQIQKANDAKRKSDLDQLRTTLEVYYNDNGRYPDYSADPDPLFYRIKPAGGYIDWGSAWTAYNVTLPKDPASAQNYVYFASVDGQSYWLYASLQRSSDPQACNGGAACSSLSTNSISSTACGTTCNYGISSSNVSP